MKINPISNPNIIKSYQASKPAAAKANKASAGLDEATFSDEAISFSRMMAEMKDKMQTRTASETEHISKLTESVRRGEYRIDSDKIADRILAAIIGG